jgi:cell wall-associated NlpC family hydrolase
MTEPITHAAIIAEARSWLGVKWKHQGRTREGVDCIGLLIVVAKGFGLTDRDEKAYSRRPDGFDFLERFKQEMDEVPLAEVADGDVIVFADGPFPCHCGLATTKNGARHFIHAHASRRCVLEEQYAHEWPRKARKAFRFRGSDKWLS